MLLEITSFQENLSYTILGIFVTLIVGAIVGSIRISIERRHKKRDQKREDLLKVLYELIDIQYEIDPLFQSQKFDNRSHFIKKYKEYIKILLKFIPIIHIYTPIHGLYEDMKPLLEWMTEMENDEGQRDETDAAKQMEKGIPYLIKVKYSGIIIGIIKIIEVELRRT